MIAAALVALDLLGRVSISRNPALFVIDTTIVIFFSLDYLTGLLLSSDKKQYIRSHLIDLISILPVYQFRALRAVRLVRLLRLVSLAMRARRRISNYFTSHVLTYVVAILFGVIALGSVSIYLVERGNSMTSFSDALWWTVVTVTTVGYGDLSPESSLGRVVAILLMITGVGALAAFTGTVASVILHRSGTGRSLSKEEAPQTEALLADLSPQEIREVRVFIDFIKYRRGKL
ncbi:voltage-gated potassium channel [Alkalispirochaeta americana]|uniref:Voltage-gated potassium channel n=1 Tax=Alkalispirochaeta americana TaxID=159291 RepID=A0A1N6P570_9SPIO|nr:voltage-gated potassium channel [Alkalispirochaeta americana]